MERRDDAAERAQRELEAARERLAEAERAADESVEDAERRLEQRSAEAEAREKRLRREMHEPTGPLLPPEPPDQKPDED
jgi:hypothetical protein